MDAWLAKIGAPGAFVPAPTLDDAGRDYLSVSWSWPDAPRSARYDYELRWRANDGGGGYWQSQRLGGASSFQYMVRGLGPGSYTLVVHALPG